MKANSRHKGKVNRQVRAQPAGGRAEAPKTPASAAEVSPPPPVTAKEEGCCSHGHDHDHGHHHHHHAHMEHEHQAGEGTLVAAAEGESEWTRRFFLFLELAVLALWAMVMVWFYASGRIEKYLVGEGLFRIQVLVAGLVLFVMGMFNWLMRAQNAGCGHDHSHDHADAEDDNNAEKAHGCCGHADGCDHDHGHSAGLAPDDHETLKARDHSCCEGDGHEHAHGHHHGGSFGGRSLALILLAMSVTAAAALTADDFSNDYKKKMLVAETSRGGAPQGETPEEYRMAPEKSEQAAAGGVTLELIEKYQKRNARGNFDLDVMQLYYSGSDAEYAKVMQGQGVETVGQVVHDPSAGGDPRKLRVFVLQVSCCAADARPFSIPVEITGPTVPQVQDMGWYKIAGKLDYIQERGVTTAVLKAEDLQATVRPRNQKMLF